MADEAAGAPEEQASRPPPAPLAQSLSSAHTAIPVQAGRPHTAVYRTGPPMGPNMSPALHEMYPYPLPGPPSAITYTTQPAPRQRTAIACRYCRRRKIRCSGFDTSEDGRCSNCARFRQECVFTPVSAQTQAFVPAHAAYPHLRQSTPAFPRAHEQPAEVSGTESPASLKRARSNENDHPAIPPPPNPGESPKLGLPARAQRSRDQTPSEPRTQSHPPVAAYPPHYAYAYPPLLPGYAQAGVGPYMPYPHPSVYSYGPPMPPARYPPHYHAPYPPVAHPYDTPRMAPIRPPSSQASVHSRDVRLSASPPGSLASGNDAVENSNAQNDSGPFVRGGMAVKDLLDPGGQHNHVKNGNIQENA